MYHGRDMKEEEYSRERRECQRKAVYRAYFYLVHLAVFYYMFIRKRTGWSKIVIGNFQCTERLPHQRKAETSGRIWTYFQVCNTHFWVYKSAEHELEWQPCSEAKQLLRRTDIRWTYRCCKAPLPGTFIWPLHAGVGSASYKGYCTITFPLKPGKNRKLSKNYEAAGLGPWTHSPLCGVKCMRWPIGTPSW